MRPKERIPIFLEKVNFKTLAERWDVDVKLFDRILNMKGTVRPKIRHYWEQKPDLRFGQMLINIGCLPDNIKIWTDEESAILDDQKVPRREFILWGSIYDENHNPLPEIKWRLIKDMKTDHIKAILKDIEDKKYNLPIYYIEVFKQEIELRNQIK